MQFKEILANDKDTNLSNKSTYFNDSTGKIGENIIKADESKNPFIWREVDTEQKPRSYANIVPEYTRTGRGVSTGTPNPAHHGEIRAHHGVDLPAPSGSQILAPADGLVIRNAFDKEGYGNYVVLQHTMANGDTVRTVYGHMKDPSLLKAGDAVTAGDEIGKVGSTGGSTGPHLHYEERLVLKGYEDAGVNGQYWKKNSTGAATTIVKDPAQDIYAFSGNPNLMTAEKQDSLKVTPNKSNTPGSIPDSNHKPIFLDKQEPVRAEDKEHLPAKPLSPQSFNLPKEKPTFEQLTAATQTVMNDSRITNQDKLAILNDIFDRTNAVGGYAKPVAPDHTLG